MNKIKVSKEIVILIGLLVIMGFQIVLLYTYLSSQETITYPTAQEDHCEESKEIQTEQIVSIEKLKPINIYEFVENSGFKGVPVEVCWECNNTNEPPAVYRVQEKRIILKPQLFPLKRTVEFIWHEYGHYVWYEILNNDQIQNYKDIYENATEFATTYAIEGGVKEDFADSFAYYMIGRKDSLTVERINYFVNLRNEAVI